MKVDPGPSGRDEPPRRGFRRRLVRPDPTAAHEVLAAALELEPQVADWLLLLATGQHPRPQYTGLLAGSIDAPDVRLQEERQQHVHRRRLARAVHAAKQQTPSRERQHLVAVLIDVDDARSAEFPALGHRRMVAPEAPADVC